MTISKNFCDETYTLCQDAITYWKYHCIEKECATDTYTRLYDLFGSGGGTAFCERQGFQVVASGGAGCVDHATYGSGSYIHSGTPVKDSSCFKLDTNIFQRTLREDENRGRFGMEYCDDNMEAFYNSGGCVVSLVLKFTPAANSWVLGCGCACTVSTDPHDCGNNSSGHDSHWCRCLGAMLR